MEKRDKIGKKKGGKRKKMGTWMMTWLEGWRNEKQRFEKRGKFSKERKKSKEKGGKKQ